MTTLFPTSLDTFPDETDLATALLDGTDGFEHAAEHDKLGEAIAALQVKVGITSSADTNSLDYKINHLSAGGAVASVNGQTGTVVLSASDVSAQPLDSDLTSIAGLSTTSFGRGLLTQADATATNTTLGLGTAAVQNVGAFAQVANNLSDVTASTARTNLGLGTAALLASSAVLQTANNLSEVTAATARTNLGLGTAATQSTGTFVQVANNLSDVTAATARTNLGLGTAATQASTAFAQLAGVSGGQILDGGTANTDTLTFLATAHGTPTTGSDIIFKSASTQLLRVRQDGWTYHGPVASGFPQYAAQTPGIEFNNNSAGAVYSSASGLGASFVGTEASAFGATVNMRNSAGTVASPTPLQSGAVIGGLRVGSLGLVSPTGIDCGQIYFRTTQIHTSTTTGTDIAFYTCADGTTTKRVVATMGQDGTFTTLAGITAPNMIDTTSAGSSTVNVATSAFGVGIRRYGASMSLNLARVNGSTGSPTALANNNDIGQFAAFGAFDTSGDVQQGATIKMTATQAWTSTNNGSKINLSTVPNNSVTQTTALILGQDQSATFAGAVSGVTSLAMNGALSGATTIAGAGALTGMTNVAYLDGTSGNASYGNVITAGLAGLQFTTAAAASSLNLIRTQGSVSSPTVVSNTNTTGQISFMGQYDTTVGDYGTGAKIAATATQNYAGAAGTATALGTKLVFSTVPNSSTTLTTALTLGQDQSATFAGAVSGVTTLTATSTVTLGSAGQVVIDSSGNLTTTGTVDGKVAQHQYPRTGAISETMPRWAITNGSVGAGATGVLKAFAIYLPKGVTITSITFVSGTTAASTPTHWWFTLMDSSLVTLRSTGDQTTTAWGATTEKTVNLSSQFTTTYAGLHYLGIMMTGTTIVSLQGVATGFASGAEVLAPIMTGTSTGSLTTPPSDGVTETALSATSTQAYAYVS